MARNRVSRLAPRFGIGEWYGKSFVRLSTADRRQLAAVAIRRGQGRTEMLCPFRSNDRPVKCSKPGGVCSLRLYRPTADGACEAVEGTDGSLRVLCPHRFKQDRILYRFVGETILGTTAPRVVAEVRFLQRVGAAQPNSSPEGARPDQNGGQAASEDVGNIDSVLVHPDADPVRWCALEIQAVYFSGKSMSLLFHAIEEYAGDGIPFPDAVRRPDYRSSGPKRLMPQLQTKVPTLRRWGKKMAVVVDASFYRNLGRMETVPHLSNTDIAWFAVDFDEAGDPVRIVPRDPYKQTLERAVEGLTGGTPVSLPDFEAKIREKLATNMGDPS